MIVNGLIVVIVAIVIVFIGNIVLSRFMKHNDDRRVYHNSTTTFANELFCLAMNKPVKYITYDDMPDCFPDKCATCPLAVYRDL